MRDSLCEPLSRNKNIDLSEIVWFSWALRLHDARR